MSEANCPRVPRGIRGNGNPRRGNNVRATLLALLACAVVLSTVAACATHSVRGRLTARATYRTEDGETITASYYRLDDDSLSFVVLEMPDGDVQTLPQLVSASGARYTDEREYQWWVKGDTARLETRDESGNWVTLHACVVE